MGDVGFWFFSCVVSMLRKVLALLPKIDFDEVDPRLLAPVLELTEVVMMRLRS
jgi:hypothetical protein